MPSYTHMRRAMPVLVAHYLLSHAAALRRDHDRLAAAAAEADAMPLGSGRNRWDGLRRSTSSTWRRASGFSRVVLNSIDASSDRDFAATFVYACALAMVHLSRLAEDFILLTSEEFGFFELADRSATGSSMMPQKKNPDPLELVRGKAGRAIGHLTGLLVTMKGLPTGYNKDLQEDKEPVFDCEDTLQCIARRGSRRDRAPDAAAGAHPSSRRPGLLLATDVADYLVARGVPVPAGPRNRRRHGPALARRSRGLRASCARRNGGPSASSSRTTSRGGLARGISRGSKNAAIDGARRGASRAGGNATWLRSHERSAA